MVNHPNRKKDLAVREAESDAVRATLLKAARAYVREPGDESIRRLIEAARSMTAATDRLGRARKGEGE